MVFTSYPGQALWPALCGFLRNNEVQNLLGEGDNDTTGQGQEAVASLGRVMGLQGKTYLDNTPAQQNEAHGPDQTEDKGTQVVDHGQGIIGRIGRHGQPQDHGTSENSAGS